jgi:hypothetical protein
MEATAKKLKALKTKSAVNVPNPQTTYSSSLPPHPANNTEPLNIVNLQLYTSKELKNTKLINVEIRTLATLAYQLSLID